MSKWRPPQENKIDPPEGGAANYVGYQKIINSKNGQIDEVKLQEHIDNVLTDSKYNWVEITPVDFSVLDLGDRIRYTTLTKKEEYLFRTGGWVIKLDDLEHEWLTYWAHTNSAWSVQREDCVRLWVSKKQKSKKKKLKIYTFKVPEEDLEYNSYLPDSNNVMQVVFSTNALSRKLYFENSFKFKLCQNKEALWRFES